MNYLPFQTYYVPAQPFIPFIKITVLIIEIYRIFITNFFDNYLEIINNTSISEIFDLLTSFISSIAHIQLNLLTFKIN